jgi:tRNA pseudouridine55 synthase
VHDIGQTLGCGAHMTALVRQASGSFSVDQAITPARLEAVVAEGRLADWLHPLDAAVQSMPAVELDADMTQRVRHGQRVQLPLVAGPACRAYAAGGALVAIMIYRAEVDLWQPDKVFDA